MKCEFITTCGLYVSPVKQYVCVVGDWRELMKIIN